MRLLGIDFGEKNLGLAVGDTSTSLVAPLGHHTVRSGDDSLAIIRKALAETGASKIVLGLPLSFGFRPTKVSQKVRAFGKALKEELEVPISFENEILTSELASRYLGYKGKLRKDSRNHAFAAALILESYMERKRNK